MYFNQQFESAQFPVRIVEWIAGAWIVSQANSMQNHNLWYEIFLQRWRLYLIFVKYLLQVHTATIANKYVCYLCVWFNCWFTIIKHVLFSYSHRYMQFNTYSKTYSTEIIIIIYRLILSLCMEILFWKTENFNCLLFCQLVCQTA